MKNSIFLFIALCGLHLQTISAQGEFVVTPFETDATSQQDIMDAVYASCTETFFETGSTVNFVLDGCDAPVLVSMDLLRSSGDPFDPTSVGREEILIDPTTSSAQFDEDGIRDVERSRGLGDVYKRQWMQSMLLVRRHSLRRVVLSILY